jgi:oligoendopeptidase F
MDRIRAMKPHQLSDEMEKFLHDLGVVGDAWERLFDETIAGLEFEMDGETLNIEATLNFLTDTDRSKREAAAREIARVLGNNVKTFARVHNTQAKEKEVLDRWRNMPTAQSGRHLSNHVEPEVVEALRDAVVAAYPKLSHRYYELKRKWLGLESMQVWDRNAPLPMDDPRIVDWDEARKTVSEAYGAFDPRMAEIAEPFFTDGWIDAAVKPGKAPGAFAHPTVTNVHPYVMLNYLGKPRDVMTLAHELGHGVHQVLAAEQGEMLSSTPLTLAETASVFGEMLTFRKMLDAAETQDQRKVLLAGKVEDMINTVVRQIAFYDFECKLHAARRESELTPEDINALWMSVQAESLGPAFEFMEGYETFWAYIPHFVHSPFYVYAYAFGDGLVNALYAVYAEGDEGFEEKYFDMLKAGGSKHHKELLAPFGLDASDPKFWDKGLSMISDMIDELEAMED